MSGEWLPPLVLLEDSRGDWDAYVQTLYEWFTVDFIQTLPRWPGKRMGLKRLPLSQGKVATFWHFISEGEVESGRNIDIRRCELIRWPRPTIELFPNRPPTDGDKIVWWKNQRKGEWRYLLALPDFSYLVVVAERSNYVLPWTQYCVEHENRRTKYRKEYEAYWASQKG